MPLTPSACLVSSLSCLPCGLWHVLARNQWILGREVVSLAVPPAPCRAWDCVWRHCSDAVVKILDSSYVFLILSRWFWFKTKQKSPQRQLHTLKIGYNPCPLHPCWTLTELVQLRNFLENDAIVNSGFSIPRAVEGAVSAGGLCLP